ncbi:hypothetical protein HZH68_003816 [Vespula germanica]|uniref:Uncharacterized protein n=1 Tax=Vespula germanica TaxID=30212 RepID=A0A834KMK5_VESGE|nr:hypothetical protein HZH68_003816 [Vespula germanica]
MKFHILRIDPTRNIDSRRQRWLPAVNWHPSDPLLALSDCEWSEMITRDLSGSLVVQDLENVRAAAFSSLGCSSPVLSTNCSACMDLNIEER